MHQATDGPDSRSGTEATRGCPYLVRMNHLAAQLNLASALLVVHLSSLPATTACCPRTNSRAQDTIVPSPLLRASAAFHRDFRNISSAELGFSGAAAHTASAAVSGAADVTALADLASAPADPEAAAGQRMWPNPVMQ